MTNRNNIELVVIGGSAGSLHVLIKILQSLESQFCLPVIIVVHRQRNVQSELAHILENVVHFKKIIEPDDKVAIDSCCAYIAPQNYHLLIENDRTFSLDYSELVQFSRPSIDVTFESAAKVYQEKVVSILLSGANNDGTKGMESIIKGGGIAIAQDPKTAEYSVMPRSAINKVNGVDIMTPEEITAFVNGLSAKGK